MSKKTRAFMAKKFEKECEINEKEAKEGMHSLILVLDHLKGNYNLGKILRTAETFSIREVHIIGTKFFDPTPAKGALKRVKIHWYNDFSQSYQRLVDLDYKIMTFDSKAQEYLNETKLEKNIAFIFGHEEFGPLSLREENSNLYPEVKNIKIKQYGLTESLNVSVAASIATYEYIRVWGS